MFSGALVLIAAASGILGLVNSDSNVIFFACLLGIVARVVQAAEHHKSLLQRLTGKA